MSPGPRDADELGDALEDFVADAMWLGLCDPDGRLLDEQPQRTTANNASGAEVVNRQCLMSTLV
jgi:hypothetical protein